MWSWEVIYTADRPNHHRGSSGAKWRFVSRWEAPPPESQKQAPPLSLYRFPPHPTPFPGSVKKKTECWIFSRAPWLPLLVWKSVCACVCLCMCVCVHSLSLLALSGSLGVCPVKVLTQRILASSLCCEECIINNHSNCIIPVWKESPRHGLMHYYAT